MDTTGDKRRVLEATDIVRLIGEQVSLKRKGREWACLCPFHDDHNPSMYVVPSKQIYHCFVCGAGGDAIRFVMDYFKMGYGEALKFLAERAGLTLTPWRPTLGHGGSGGEQDEADTGVSRQAILSANSTACDFFRVILAHPEHGKAAREFIDRRALTPEIVEQFQIGAAPDRWDGLVRTIEKKGLDLRPFAAAGLIKARERGEGHYDALRHRAVFPICDSLGRVIAFGGRRLREEDDPKYLNSPETMLFSKSATLYALPQASAAIRTSGVAIVTEGYMDAIACHQAGVKNVVATLGTALTTQSARVLSRLCRTVVLLFDGDEAGQRAADRAVEVFFSASLDVKIATIKGAGVTDAKDPDDLLKKPDGRALLDRVLKTAVDALVYRFDRLRDRTVNLPIGARSAAIEEELGRLGELGLSALTPVRQEMVVKRIASLAGIETSAVRAAVARQAGKRRAGPRGLSPAQDGGQANEEMRHEGVPSKPRTNAELALACCLAEPALVLDLSQEDAALIGPDAFSTEVLKKVASQVDRARLMGQTCSTQTVLAGIDDASALRVATGFALEVSRMTGLESSSSLREPMQTYLNLARAERRLSAARSSAVGNGEGAIVARVSALAAVARETGGGPAQRSLPKPPTGSMQGRGT